MTAPRVGVVASARGRCTVCGPNAPGWVRLVGVDEPIPCPHCNRPPTRRPVPIFIYPWRTDRPKRTA